MWNASVYGGITQIQMPVSNVWVPDITMYSSVNSEYERYKEDTIITVNHDGLVRWLTPAIYTSSCLIRVRYFPFDTQVCVMQFASWGLTGAEINIFPEETPDATQDKYLHNGVWDMVSGKVQKGTKKYICCPEPYYELNYRLIFKRQYEFYVLYLILPCVFLSSLSLMVFYLPPECGEKLTLSITNLLAMVVFQQLIAETMPPTGDDSPLIGDYFLVMIVMVCLSVVATALVIHCKYTSRPVPKRVKQLFLEVLPKYVGLKYLQRDSKCIRRDSEIPLATSTQCGTDTTSNLLVKSESTSKIEEYKNGDTVGTIRDIRRGISSPELKEINGKLQKLHFLMNDIIDRRADDNIRCDWNKISAVIDRFLMYIFIAFALLSTSIIMFEILYGSRRDYYKEIEISDSYNLHDNT
ncbi:neuronal acetylcholine receptor subunit beta-4-like [Amphiura filiformis]|uniref:neuronal acetylcholine receptor subunit beta-4-like n=1 Tax=Amphiura filiformis TaxID=82378 RepID=UPI003B2162A7